MTAPTLSAQPAGPGGPNRPGAPGQPGGPGQLGAPRPVAQPQRVPAPEPGPDAAPGQPARSKRWLLLAGGAVVVVIVAIVAVVALVTGGSDNSPEAQVKGAVNSYTNALASGNLSQLQSATCGKLHDFYQNIAPDQYAGVHKLAVDQKKIPKVAGVDGVQITGDKAVAQVDIYTDADPSRSTARTFDLQQTDGGWKVCDPAGAAQ
ncbi:hypothetical protein A5780_12070 [Nocardia sp. 852002-20019_SCH5090214]|uniref:DUF4878 domain-containing protein n=2 Tax=Nocardia nova TaxID=37330 RepID=A0A2S5ZW66_9NOCA|nr:MULTISPECIES: hypothetical protein [Nocardia]OBA48705.1 hypothetical protein A5789_33545 [Nocardia sp. 852002-51101_SCH5132738]OBB37591.1 hypothetical protein A5748_03360 [Nocardia sp. 852002-51244_SCH5132740]OBF73172.1 hypothetical protein A9X06_03415 [Mycobacterium sp. 852002-51759_SCH5129042]OBA66991.1 hypothetical protein A5780_12070 [Nocardia sp. 852002-20019_SCH5090214]PPI89163.1 hypothetical protein C5E46_34865 [Nocardia nova]